MWDVNVPGKVKEEGKEKGGQGVESKSRAHASPASRQVVLYRLDMGHGAGQLSNIHTLLNPVH